MLFPVLLCRCIVGTADGARKEGRNKPCVLGSPLHHPTLAQGTLCLGPAQITFVEWYGKALRLASHVSL